MKRIPFCLTYGFLMILSFWSLSLDEREITTRNEELRNRLELANRHIERAQSTANTEQKLDLLIRAYEIYHSLFDPAALRQALGIDDPLISLSQLTWQDPTDPARWINARDHTLDLLGQFYRNAPPSIQNRWKEDAQQFYEKLQRARRLNPTLLQRAYFYLPTPSGFGIFYLLASRYFESGDLTMAMELWEAIKTYSIGYDLLTKSEKLRFLSHLASISLRLGWRKKYEGFRSEIESISQDSELFPQEAQALISQVEEIGQTLNTLAQSLENCPPISSYSLTQTIQTLTYQKEDPSFSESRHWTYTLEDDETFVSDPLTHKGKIYLLVTTSEGGLILLTLSQQTGERLNKTLIATHNEGWLMAAGDVFPYQLEITEDTLLVKTELADAQVTLNGNIRSLINLTHPSQLSAFQGRIENFYYPSLMRISSLVLGREEKPKDPHLLVSEGAELDPQLVQLFKNLGDYVSTFEDPSQITSQLLNNARPENRLLIPLVLRRVGRQGIPVLIRNLGRTEVQDEIMNALYNLTSTPHSTFVQTELIEALSHNDPNIRKNAKEFLENIYMYTLQQGADSDLYPLVQTLIDDPNPEIREAAAGLLPYFYTSEEANLHLREILEGENDENLRHTAIPSLLRSSHPNREELLRLIDVHQDGDVFMQTYLRYRYNNKIRDSIRHIGAPLLPAILNALGRMTNVDDQNINYARFALEMLLRDIQGEREEQEAETWIFPELKNALNPSSPLHVRLSVMVALGNLLLPSDESSRQEEVIEIFESLREDPSIEIRERANFHPGYITQFAPRDSTIDQLFDETQDAINRLDTDLQEREKEGEGGEKNKRKSPQGRKKFTPIPLSPSFDCKEGLADPRCH